MYPVPGHELSCSKRRVLYVALKDVDSHSAISNKPHTLLILVHFFNAITAISTFLSVGGTARLRSRVFCTECNTCVAVVVIGRTFVYSCSVLKDGKKWPPVITSPLNSSFALALVLLSCNSNASPSLSFPAWLRSLLRFRSASPSR